MPNKLPPNPTWEDYRKDYGEWRTRVLQETLDEFGKALSADEGAMDILQKEIDRKKKHVELIEAELAKR